MNLFTSALSIFGRIETPPGVEKYGGIAYGGTGLIDFLSNIIKLIAVGGGLFSLINLILAGLGYISASGDPKKTAAAWSKIWMSLVGLLIIVSSFVLAAVFGYIFFGKWSAILAPQIYGPGAPETPEYGPYID